MPHKFYLFFGRASFRSIIQILIWIQNYLSIKLTKVLLLVHDRLDCGKSIVVSGFKINVELFHKPKANSASKNGCKSFIKLNERYFFVVNTILKNKLICLNYN